MTDVALADLRLILRNTEKATRDAQAAVAAVELIGGLGARFEAIETVRCAAANSGRWPPSRRLGPGNARATGAAPTWSVALR